MSDQKNSNTSNGAAQPASISFANHPKSQSQIKNKMLTDIFKRSSSAPFASSGKK